MTGETLGIAEAYLESEDESCDIYQLSKHRCRFPLAAMSDRPPYRYCGKPTVPGSPYCQYHTERAINDKPFRLRGSLTSFRR